MPECLTAFLLKMFDGKIYLSSHINFRKYSQQVLKNFVEIMQEISSLLEVPRLIQESINWICEPLVLADQF